MCMHYGCTIIYKYVYACVCVLFATLWAVAQQASLSMGFPRKEYLSGLDFLLQQIFPPQGSNLSLLHWQADFFTTESWGKPGIRDTRGQMNVASWGFVELLPVTGEFSTYGRKVETVRSCPATLGVWLWACCCLLCLQESHEVPDRVDHGLPGGSVVKNLSEMQETQESWI